MITLTRLHTQKKKKEESERTVFLITSQKVMTSSQKVICLFFLTCEQLLKIIQKYNKVTGTNSSKLSS